MFIISFVGLSAAPYPEKVPVSLENVESYDAVAPAKIVYDAIQRTRYQNYEGDLYIYSHKTGHISIGDHDRVSIAIYDSEGQWVETRLYPTSIEKAELEEIRKHIRKALSKKPGYKASDPDLEYGFQKIIQKNGSWLEVSVEHKATNRFANLIIGPGGFVRIDEPE